MRAITLWQPWASLIAEGIKTIETRPKQHPWRSAINTTIAIHAAAKLPRIGAVGDYRVRGVGSYGFALEGPGLPAFRSTPRREGYGVPLGAVVATCRLVDVVPILGRLCGADMGQPTHICDSGAHLLLHLPEFAPLDGQTEFDVSAQRPFGDFGPDRWALILENVRKLTHPVRCRGYQGLWTLPREVEVTAGLMVG